MLLCVRFGSRLPLRKAIGGVKGAPLMAISGIKRMIEEATTGSVPALAARRPQFPDLGLAGRGGPRRPGGHSVPGTIGGRQSGHLSLTLGRSSA
jgi:hypothetical protein